MTKIEPGNGDQPTPSEATETQQQLAEELEAIAAGELARPDVDEIRKIAEQKQANKLPLTTEEEQALRTTRPVKMPEGKDDTHVIYEAEGITNPEQANKKVEFEKAISELRQRVMGAMVDIAGRVRLINTEAQGEEDLAIDPQFTRTIQVIREEVINRIPDLADQCWRVGNEAREEELVIMGKIDKKIVDAADILVKSGQRASERLSDLGLAVSQDMNEERVSSALRGVNQSLKDGLDLAGKGLASLPEDYGEVEEVMKETVTRYLRLLEATNRPLTDDEYNEMVKFVNQKQELFIDHLRKTVKLERTRIEGVTKSMRQFYMDEYSPAIGEALDGLERPYRLH